MKRFFLYFGFNQIEQRGFILFSFLILLLLFTPYFGKVLQKADPIPYEVVYFENASSNLEQPSLELTARTEFKSKGISKSKHSEIVYFYFDPNNLDTDSWSRLGFTAKQIQVIKNYESKGGRFYKKEDVAKIYVISHIDYKRIEPYIKIESKKKE